MDSYIRFIVLLQSSLILVYANQCENTYGLNCNNIGSEYCRCDVLPDVGRSPCRVTLNCKNFNGDTFRDTMDLLTHRNDINSRRLVIINATLTSCDFYELMRNYTDYFDGAKFLNLSFNGITRITADAFATSRELEVLDLSRNKISDLPEGIFTNLTYLKMLDLSHNNIGMIGSNTFDNLKNLNSLDLSRNILKELWPRWFRSLRNLHTLSVAHNQLTTMKKEVLESTNLLRINLMGNPWNCDKNLHWLYLWLENNKDKIQNLDSVRCEEPEKLNETLMKGLELVHLNKIINDAGLCTFCNCTVVTHRNFITVDCSNRNLTTLPDSLPNRTKQVDLSNNQITFLTLKQDSLSHWDNVRFLRLSNNHISSLHSLEGSIFVKKLIALDISSNKLREIPIYLLDQLIRLEIHLGGNPWKCDCNTVTFQTWLQENYQLVMDLENIRCAIGEGTHSNSIVYKIQKSDLCPQERIINYLDIVNVVIGILIVAVISKVSFDYWRQKRTGKLPRFFSLN